MLRDGASQSRYERRAGTIWELQMTFVKSLAVMTFAAATAFTVATTSVRADDCDDIVDALKKLNERIMNDKNDAKTVPAICAAIGQVLGVVKAAREAAAECYEEGKKRDEILLTLDKATKEMDGQVDQTCK
jgi:hypothetical protein